MAYSAPSSVRLYSSRPRLSRMASRGLAARGRAEQQQQPAPHVRAGRGRLEVVDDARQRRVDAVQLPLETARRARAVLLPGGVVLAVPAQHVPDVLVAGTRELHGTRRQHRGEEVAEVALPVLRAMLAAVGPQGLDETQMTERAGACGRGFHVSASTLVDPGAEARLNHDAFLLDGSQNGVKGQASESFLQVQQL